MGKTESLSKSPTGDAISEESATRLDGSIYGNTSLIRHDYKRACYRAMLSEFTPEDVVEFFHTLPMILDGRRIQGPELFQLLWREKEKIPIYWEVITDNLIEPFLIRKGRDVQTVLRKILWLNNQSTYIPGKVLLTWFYPKLESLFNSVDTRDMVFALIALFTENYLPKHIHRRIKRWEEGEWVHSIQVFISDIDFREVIDWDYDLIAGPQILNGPVMFGLLPFEGFGMISDTRSPGAILWDKSLTVTLNHGVFALDGNAYGKLSSFQRFCSEKELDLSKYQPPDSEIVVMEKDYYCPQRKRIVLHKDCAYGAPVFLNWVTHRKLKVQGKAILSSFIGDIEREENLQDKELEKAHQAVLNLSAGRAEFTYHEADESITLSGQHFTKGVPAKILKFLLESHVSQGKSEFEYRELKRLFEITQGQKNSNFEVRFYRLIEKLESETAGLRIEKTGRGRFRLVLTGKLEFKSVAS
jgi:hypothetical protein